MSEIYKSLLEKFEQSSDSQIIVTSIDKCGQGEVKEFNREFAEQITEEEKKRILLSGIPQCMEREDRLLFAEPYYRKERIVIFGGGHVALPLVKLAKIVGFYVVVVDDRIEFANKERFTEADEVICDSYEHCMEKVKPSINDYFVIVTRGHLSDTMCVRQLMKYEESVYTGLIGSRKRTAIDIKQLEEEGYDKGRLSRVCTPIGLPIGAATTEEIGISIMAEIIKRKRLESTDNMAIERSDIDYYVMTELADNTENCCVATIMYAEGSAPRKAGAKMIIYPDSHIKGSIGGGRMEASVITKALTMIGTGRYEVIDVVLNGEDAMAEGMLCGGRVKLLLEDFSGNR